MTRFEASQLPLWQFNQLKAIDRIQHFVSGRSLSHNAEFTLSQSSVSDPSLVDTNRRLLSAALSINPGKLYMPSQVHGVKVVEIKADTRASDLNATDALITAERNCCIAVRAADCVPIVLYDRRRHVAGVVHSGWRGTVAKILERTLHAMENAFGTRGDDLLACIGPSAGPHLYEVGTEVIQAAEHAFGSGTSLLRPTVSGKALFDLWDANRQQLSAFGVPDENIEVSGMCTLRHNEHFFSARRGDTGRFAAGIVLL